MLDTLLGMFVVANLILIPLLFPICFFRMVIYLIQDYQGSIIDYYDHHKGLPFLSTITVNDGVEEINFWFPRQVFQDFVKGEYETEDPELEEDTYRTPEEIEAEKRRLMDELHEHVEQILNASGEDRSTTEGKYVIDKKFFSMRAYINGKKINLVLEELKVNLLTYVVGTGGLCFIGALGHLCG